jgi:hypothetical protein
MASSEQELEERWRKCVQDARSRYLHAKEVSGYALREQAEGLTPPPDGSLAARRALHIENAALAEYIRTLKIFSDLVINRRIPIQIRKIPGESSDSKARGV